MVDIDKFTTRIEKDEDSVRAAGAGRGRLLEDLRSVPASMVRDVFDRVYSDDSDLNKSTVIDIQNGKLVISDAFKTESKPQAPAEKAAAPGASDCHAQVKTAAEALLGVVGATGTAWLMKQLDSQYSSQDLTDYIKQHPVPSAVAGGAGGVGGFLLGKHYADDIATKICKE